MKTSRVFTALLAWASAVVSVSTAQDVTTGLVLSLPFDSSTADSSANRFTFSEAGTMRYVADHFGVAGRALDFVTAPADGIFLRGTGPALANQSSSVAFWIKKNGQSPGWLFAIGDGVSPGVLAKEMTVALGEGTVVRYSFFYDDFDTPLVPVLGVWNHWAFTFDVTTRTRRFFLNGNLVASNQAAFAFTGGTALRISAANMTLDDVRLYNRALSTADVLALANLPSAPVIPPVIGAQPASQAVAAGGNATFSVAASGISALSYQWLKDGVNLPGATTASLAITNVQPVHVGDYGVVITQSTGSVTSSTASLTIPGVPTGLWRGIVAYYPFNSNASDQTPFANHATPAGNYQYLTNGLAGGALRITGDSSLFYAGGGHVLLPKFGTFMNAGFTLSLWIRDESLVNTSAVHEQSIIGFGPLDSPQVDITLDSATPRLRFVVDGATGGNRTEVTASTSFPSGAGNWKHLLLTYVPGKFVAYLNGAKIDERTVTAAIFPPATAALGRGYWSGGASSASRMSATYDNVRVYNRALSESEVQQLYASEAPSVGPTIATSPSTQTVVEGQPASLSVVATGTAPLSYQWTKNGVPINGATGASLVLDAARMADAGSYAVTVSNPVSVTTSAAVVLTVKSANPGRLRNLSIRTATGGANGNLIVGFVVGGAGTSGTSSLLARASGPALVQFGVTGVLPDPILSLYDGGRLIDSNDNWGNSPTIAAAAGAVGAFAFPTASRDAAVSASLGPGGYTAQVFDSNGAAGVALAEIYDTTASFSYSRPRLVNVSARAIVGTGGDVLITGFVVVGETPLTVLVRGVGPTLSQFGVTGVLANPRLTLFREATIIATNDDWGDVGASTIASTAASVGAFALPQGSRDAAIVATLQPGTYTAQVSGVGGTGGGALAEVYEVP